MKNFSYSPVAIAIWGVAALCPTFALADNSTSSTDNATIETMTVVGKDKNAVARDQKRNRPKHQCR